MGSANQPLLSSWKEIAAYLRVSVRTAQLWESERGLPVNRPPGRRGVVWANPAELDDWRKSADVTPQTTAPALPRSRRRTVLMALAATAFLTLTGWSVVFLNASRDQAGRSAPLATSPGRK